MVKNSSYMFITGPEVIKTVTNEIITKEDLGGAEIHASKSGVTDFVCENDIETLMQVRRLFSFLPLSNPI